MRRKQPVGTAGLSLEKQELSCVNVQSVVQYLGDKIGRDGVAEVIEPLGLPLAFLENKHNWVSFDYYNRLLDKLVETTGDENAPFDAAFSVKPQEIYDFILYAAYTTVWSGSPRSAYLLSLGSNFYKRWTKIGDFQILSSTPTTIRIALTLKEGYTQTRNNCLAVRGILASVPMGMGLPRAEIVEDQCAVHGHRSCVYSLKWRNRSNWLGVVGFPALAAALILECLVFRGTFGVKDIALTVLGFSTLYFLGRSLQYWRELRTEEHISQRRNEHLLVSMQKTEADYARLLETQTQLEERSRYLSIVNEIGIIVARDTTVDTLVRSVTSTLIDRLRLPKGEFFRYDTATRSFEPILTKGPAVSEEEYLRAEAPRYSFSPRAWAEYPALASWRGDLDTSLLVLPVSTPGGLSGFFCFASNPKDSLPPSLAESLCENVSRQLKVAFLRIASKNAIDQILASIPAHVLIFSRHSLSVTYVNEHYLKSYDKAEEEIVGAPLRSALPFDDDTAKAVAELAHSVGLGGRSDLRETAFGPSVFQYSVFAVPQETEERDLVGIIISDISEARSFHRNLLINQKLLALGRVASGIAHEINNPLYAILANAEEIVEDPGLTGDSKQLAEEIIEHVVNVSDVIKDLSHYSKTLRKEELVDVDLNEVIEESLVLVKYGSNVMEINVEKDLHPLPRLRATKGEMQQVFINIFNNAVQAMRGKGLLCIASRCPDDKIEITISDTGKGISEADLPNIFDLFFTTKPAGEGTGQGLYIVKKILTMYGGTIRAESREGQGATFTVEFKVTQSPDGAGAPAFKESHHV